jgi:DNA-binding CsgD family transcriptional regulator
MPGQYKMNKIPFTIFLSDNNHYLVQGLRSVLEAYFFQHGIKARITGNLTQYKTCQVAIIPYFNEECSLSHYLHNYLKDHCPMTFLMLDEGKLRFFENFSLRQNQQFLSRSKSVDQLLQQLTWAFKKFSFLQQENGHYCCCSPTDNLTTREVDVIKYWSSGLETHVISEKMGISLKTISTHKRNAMKKMNLSKNIELYTWAKDAGLAQSYSTQA